ncbi:MAG TPA: cobalamin-binding protein [Dongiaceae bacterium]|nr:cobalamin-binding protein [Dongiaceae bacterium]
MSFSPGAFGARRIVCLTEEFTEILYLLGEDQRIVGISGFTVRPPRARKEKPKVSAFTSAKIDKILELKPDLVLGFSDLQADIAAQLIRAGVTVAIFNQRSVADIYDTIYRTGALVGAAQKAETLIAQLQDGVEQVRVAAQDFPRRPRVFFEEWPEPSISAIRWVSELITIAGGEDCFAELSLAPDARSRIIADPQEIVRRAPDIIIGSWCGRKFSAEQVRQRPGWENVPAVRHQQLFEIKSPDILQPGPAALTDGLRQLHAIIAAWVQG